MEAKKILENGKEKQVTEEEFQEIKESPVARLKEVGKNIYKKLDRLQG